MRRQEHRIKFHGIASRGWEEIKETPYENILRAVDRVQELRTSNRKGREGGLIVFLSVLRGFVAERHFVSSRFPGFSLSFADFLSVLRGCFPFLPFFLRASS